MRLLLISLRLAAPGFWLLTDLLSGFALWLLARKRSRRWQNRALALRRLAVPYAALLVGAVAPQGMGLAGLDWQVGLTLGVGIAGGMLLLLGMAHVAARAAAPAALPAPSPAPETAGGAHLVYGLLYHGAQQFHWCFLRAALLGVVQSAVVLWPGRAAAAAAPEYWAIWGAVLLALPSLWSTEAGLPRLHQAIALAATAVLFLYTRNFWLCWALHAGIMLFAGPSHLHAAQPPRPAQPTG